MKHYFKMVIAASVVAAVACSAGIASAGGPPDAACHAAIGKAIAKYQATLAKNLIGCHKSRSGGKIAEATNCNDAVQADLKGKRTDARAKVNATIDGKCTPDLLTEFQGFYPRCPSPAATSDNGGTPGIDSFDELGTCLADLSEAYIDRVGAQVMGNPTTGGVALPKGLASCQGGIGKALSKAVKTVTGNFAKCQAGTESGGATSNVATCLAAIATDGKSQPSIDAITTAINTSCVSTNVPTQADWITLHMCGQSTDQMVTCAVGRTASPTIKGLAAEDQGFPNTGGNLQCASFADVLINAGHGEEITNTRLDSGFTGAGHRVDVIDQSIGSVKLQNCNADCEDCQVRIDTAANSCRCADQPTVHCDVAPTTSEQVDNTHCTTGSHLCTCMFGPPLPLSSAGVPVCIVNRFSQEYTGGTSVVGSYDVGTRTRSFVFNGINQLRPCPTCEGDTTLNDGVRGGHCQYEDTDPPGIACDGNAVTEFGGIENVVSFDCPPDPAKGIGSLNLGLQFTDGTTTLNAAITTGSGNCASGTCHCSQCSGDPSAGCATNADCAAIGAGTCGQNLGANNPSQNSCTGGVSNCVSDPLNPGMGACNAGPFDKYCNGALRADGGGIIPCSSDASCLTYNSICAGGDCGTCDPGLPNAQRSCFLSTISSTGLAGIYNSQGESVFCSAQTASSSVNSAAGLPGPTRVKLDFDFNLYCSNHTTNFDLPSGANCP